MEIHRMSTQSLKLAYFSPTGTTKTIVHAIARGIGHTQVELIDITKSDVRSRSLRTSEDDLLVVAVPVYIGRVPAIVMDWLDSIEAHSTPTVCVVVYGNRAYEDALLELEDTLKKRGCVPIASAAYVGEHSFSSDETPIAGHRPDAVDLGHAEAFGRKVAEKLASAPSQAEALDLATPGNRPYRGSSKLWDVDFIAVGDVCTQCGMCAEVCPADAVDAGHSDVIDQVKCITCCACIKNCPQSARTMKPSPVKDAALRLNRLYGERKQPEFFL
jgi:ferredoxin